MEKYDYREAVCEYIREHNIEVTEEQRMGKDDDAVAFWYNFID